MLRGHDLFPAGEPAVPIYSAQARIRRLHFADFVQTARGPKTRTFGSRWVLQYSVHVRWNAPLQHVWGHSALRDACGILAYVGAHGGFRPNRCPDLHAHLGAGKLHPAHGSANAPS